MKKKKKKKKKKVMTIREKRHVFERSFFRRDLPRENSACLTGRGPGDDETRSRRSASQTARHLRRASDISIVSRDVSVTTSSLALAHSEGDGSSWFCEKKIAAAALVRFFALDVLEPHRAQIAQRPLVALVEPQPDDALS